MEASLWDESRLIDLESDDPDVKAAGEAYLGSLGPEGAAEVIKAFDSLRTGCLEVLIGAVVVTLQLAASDLKSLYPFSNGVQALIHFAILCAGAAPLLVIEHKQRGRLRLVTRALFCLRGDKVANEIMTWLRNARASRNQELRQLALRSLATQIEENGGNMPSITSENRNYMHSYAKKYLREEGWTGEGEVVYKRSALQWSSNLFTPRQAEQLQAIARSRTQLPGRKP